MGERLFTSFYERPSTSGHTDVINNAWNGFGQTMVSQNVAGRKAG